MIDSWLPSDGWPATVLASVRRFRQGHLLAWDSVVYGLDFDHSICNDGARADESGTGYVKRTDLWPYVVITTQTCDICEEGKSKPKMPFISVAPVYDILPFLANAGQAKQIRANGFKYLVPLTHVDFSSSETLYVADLRIEFPLEKSCLVDKEPHKGFSLEEEYQYFADKLASRRNRAAIDARVRDLIIGPLAKTFTNGAIDHQPIVEMRLRCGPEWDYVERAQLIAVVRDYGSVSSVEDQFDAWQKTFEDSLPSDLTLMPIKVVAAAALTYQEALRTAPVDYSEVS